MVGVEGVRFSFDSGSVERRAINPQETDDAERMKWSGLMGLFYFNHLFFRFY